MSVKPNTIDRALQLLLKYLDQKISETQDRQEQCRDREAEEDLAHQRAAALPVAAMVDKILRYESALERQLYRALNQLERRQRIRHGEAISAPLTLDISTKD
jgi:CRISPR/Cas system-associated endonuclease Cas1